MRSCLPRSAIRRPSTAPRNSARFGASALRRIAGFPRDQPPCQRYARPAKHQQRQFWHAQHRQHGEKSGGDEKRQAQIRRDLAHAGFPPSVLPRCCLRCRPRGNADRPGADDRGARVLYLIGIRHGPYSRPELSSPARNVRRTLAWRRSAETQNRRLAAASRRFIDRQLVEAKSAVSVHAGQAVMAQPFDLVLDQ